MRSVQARAAREGKCRRVGKMMPTYHMYPHSTASCFSTLRPCFRVNFYSVALKLSCNMCVVPTRETFCGSQVAVLAWCTTMGCNPFYWCIFRRHHFLMWPLQYFFHFNQNLTSDCPSIYVFCISNCFRNHSAVCMRSRMSTRFHEPQERHRRGACTRLR